MQIDLCSNCGTRLDADTSEALQDLLPMTTVSAQSIQRITSEEEERMRFGFSISSHYQFSRDHVGLRRVEAQTNGATTLQLHYGHAATMWRVNHGWRRSKIKGFNINLRSGMWANNPDEDAPGLEESNDVKSNVRLVVNDTRNILLVQPDLGVAGDTELLLSLQSALIRGILTTFQLEEQELGTQVLGVGATRRMLLWEASEGGAGVLRHLVEDPTALARVAQAALEICHFDPLTGENQPDRAGECVRACYHCLLSYSNQPEHHHLNRHAVRDLLLSLTHDTVAQTADSPATELDALLEQTASPFAREVLTFLHATARRLPDAVEPEKFGVRPHLFYESRDGSPTTCVLCAEDGESLDALRYTLEEDAGFKVIILRRGQPLAQQIEGRQPFER